MDGEARQVGEAGRDALGRDEHVARDDGLQVHKRKGEGGRRKDLGAVERVRAKGDDGLKRGGWGGVYCSWSLG